ncbi:MAG: MbnP family protein [Raineya sp.]
MKYIVWILSIWVVVSCKPASQNQVGENGTLAIELQHFFGDKTLKIGDSYTNSSNETFTLTKLDYFISNIALEKQDGSFYAIPQDESYFLIKLSEGAKPIISLKNIPLGEYKGIRFLLGVDSLRNTMEPARRTGDLDVGGRAEGMYWVWNTGYIFLKMEGNSNVVPDEQDKKFIFHIGGYGGYSSPTINNLKTISIKFLNENLKINPDKNAILHLKIDASKIFNANKTIRIADNPSVMFSPVSVDIADNYANMFSLDFVHN